jgi:hypothetical protein
MFKRIFSSFLAIFFALPILLPILAFAQNGGGGNASPQLIKLSGTDIVPVNPEWTIGGGGGIADVVEDLTPQAGGNFDMNGHGIIFPGSTVTDVTGADTKLVSGTDGTSGNLASWNVDGDLVDSNLAVVNFSTKDQGVMVLSPSESCATGDGAGDVAFRVPVTLNGWDLVNVGFGVTTAGTTGNFDIQIRNATQAADMLTTKMRVETGETDTITSAQPGTIDTGNDDVATGDKIYFDIDSCQSTPALGALLSLTFKKP